MFKHEILNEIGRCLNMPYNVIAANSADYNYASGRLDWQVYFKFIKTVRGWIERIVLNRIFWTWFREAILVTDYFNKDLRTTIKIRNLSQIKPQWFWPGSEHVDPLKEANAQRIRLIENKTTTYAYEYAMQGKDWEREFRQIAKEQKLMEELGIKIQIPKGNNQAPNRKTNFNLANRFKSIATGKLLESGDNGNGDE
jgi:capsid protein